MTKLATIATMLKESDTELDTPEKAPHPSGSLLTTAQSAKILGVSMSRVRQYIQDGTLTPESGPEPGSRDNFLRAKDIHSLKDKQVDGQLPITGRPPKSGKSSKSDKKD